MKTYLKYIFIFLLLAIAEISFAQNETSKWYFGDKAGLDFMTNPPTVILNSAMSHQEGSASIADATGNLLFYTDGITVWNQSNAVMANGTGLLGHGSSSQSALIVKQPGNNNLYFIFTSDHMFGSNGVNYSVVDMNLAAGMGSVTIKNAPLTALGSERIAATKHCNGTDVWVISHDKNSSSFRANLITSSGLNSTAVFSSIGSSIGGLASAQGFIKISPNGKKLIMSIIADASTNNAFELFDFDNATGIISNSLTLLAGGLHGYGCEFSPDGRKVYGAMGHVGTEIYQWDLCAGSNAAILASQYSFVTGATCNLQLAPDGKIYAAQYHKYYLGVINNPNLAGAACNYVDQGQVTGTNQSFFGLPNMMGSFLKKPSTPFTYSVNINSGCTNVSFFAPVSSCNAVSYPIANLSWNFGDPSSGSANTSTLSNPTHAYSSIGTYTTQLILYNNCGGVIDTIKQEIVTSGSTPVSAQAFSICNGQSINLIASGNITYTWSTGANSSNITVSPSVTTTYSVSGITSAGCTNSAAITVTVLPSASITINGSNTICPGSSVIQTASGVSNYTWSTGATTNTVSLNPTTSTIYTVTGNNGTGCSSTATILINVISVSGLSVNNATACFGGQAVISVQGNTAGFTYNWFPGSSNSSSIIVTPTTTSNYTLVATHTACNLSVTLISTVTINAIASAITGFNYSSPICDNAGTVSPLVVNGFNTGGVFTSAGLNIDINTGVIDLSSSASGTYVVTYFFAATGCTTAASSSANIVILPSPNLIVNNNINILPGANATLSVSGGPSYTWSPADHLSCVNCDNPVASPPDNIQYCVSSQLNGCVSTKCIYINVTCEIGYDHSVPNAFTPNNDGHNDTFCLQGWTDCITDFTVMIFDRWGEKVFQSNDPSFCWDGIYKGQLMNAGVFVYVIKATKIKEQINKKGNITLIR